jgi:hypothetical protein
VSAGRPRSIDKGEALNKAMRLFWDNGYAVSSVAGFAKAPGINKPSL